MLSLSGVCDRRRDQFGLGGNLHAVVLKRFNRFKQVQSCASSLRPSGQERLIYIYICMYAYTYIYIYIYIPTYTLSPCLVPVSVWLGVSVNSQHKHMDAQGFDSSISYYHCHGVKFLAPWGVSNSKALRFLVCGFLVCGLTVLNSASCPARPTVSRLCVRLCLVLVMSAMHVSVCVCLQQSTPLN